MTVTPTTPVGEPVPSALRDKNRQQKERRLAIHNGTHEYMVDAEPVRAHVRTLMTTIPYPQVANLAGVGRKTVSYLLYGRPSEGRPPASRVFPRTARALLSVSITQLPEDPAALISVVGTQRRLQGLAFLGWPLGVIAAEAGLSRGALKQLPHAPAGRRVTVAVARKVRDAHARLWQLDPMEHGVRPTDAKTLQRRARAHGWVSAMAWDGSIDDPEATPDRGAKTFRYEAIAEDAAELLGQRIAPEFVAKRLGVSEAYLEKAASRARRALTITSGETP